MFLDYNIKIYYPQWEKSSNRNPITSSEILYIEIIIHNDNVCDNVNKIFNTGFRPNAAIEIYPSKCYDIMNYLRDKENHFVGTISSNWNELADDYWKNNYYD